MAVSVSVVVFECLLRRDYVLTKGTLDRVLLVLLVKRVQHPQVRHLVRRLPERHWPVQEGGRAQRAAPRHVRAIIVFLQTVIRTNLSCA